MLRRGLLALMLLAYGVSELPAQFFPGPTVVPGVPVLVPNGIGFDYRTRRLRVSGFFNTGYSVGVVPAGGFFPGPAPFVPYAPFYPIPTAGYIDTRVTYTVVAPTVILAPRGPIDFDPDRVDLSGVDLDAAPSPLKAYEGRFAKKTEKKEPLKLPEPMPREIVPPPVPVPKEEKVFRPEPVPKELPLPKKVVLGPLEMGIQAFADGEFGSAAFHFEDAAAAAPASGRPLFLLGQTFFAQGKFRHAVDAIARGLKLDPDLPTSAFDPRAELYKGIEEEYLLQRKLLDDLAAEHPKNGTYLFLQGYLLWFEGRRDEARKLFLAARPLLADPVAADLFLKAPAVKVAGKSP